MAKYSLLNFENEVFLYDAYEPLIKMWHCLQGCSPADILSLPKSTKIKKYIIIMPPRKIHPNGQMFADELGKTKYKAKHREYIEPEWIAEYKRKRDKVIGLLNEGYTIEMIKVMMKVK